MGDGDTRSTRGSARRAAQLIGGIAGAFALWAVFANSGAYSCAATGLGTDGWGIRSMIGLQAGGAVLAEVILTFVFVLVVLLATRHATTAGFAGLAIGAGLLIASRPAATAGRVESVDSAARS
jgi:aquaporin Z